MTAQPESQWWEDLDKDELADLFPGGQADIDAFDKRQRWRAEHQNFPRECTNEAKLLDLARLMLGSD